jgi:hypothetical protein
MGFREFHEFYELYDIAPTSTNVKNSVIQHNPNKIPLETRYGIRED